MVLKYLTVRCNCGKQLPNALTIKDGALLIICEECGWTHYLTFLEKCQRCDHIWMPQGKKPKVCPSCKSPYWDTKRKSKRK